MDKRFQSLCKDYYVSKCIAYTRIEPEVGNMHLRKGLLPGISYRLLLCFSIGFIACVGSESTTATTPSSTLPAELPPEIVSSSTKPPLQEWKEYDVPSPRKDIYSCGRNKKSWICDPDGILTEDEGELKGGCCIIYPVHAAVHLGTWCEIMFGLQPFFFFFFFFLVGGA